MKKRIVPFCLVLTLLLGLWAWPAAAVGDVIDFTRDSFTLYPNQSFPLTMKKNVTIASYTSSDPGIVSVNAEGMVKALSVGTSVVTATDEQGNQAACTVTVRDGTAPQQVALETQSVTLTEGESYTLKAAVEPADADDPRLYYSSSDDTIVRVDKNGNLKALKAGDAVITVESGSAAVSAKCMIKVTAKAGRNFSVSLNGTLYSVAGERKRNVIVEIANASESFETTTDTEGKFYFDGIVRGSYTLRVLKNVEDTKPLASGQLSVGTRDMNLSCIINDGQLVILYQSEKEGTEEVQDIIPDKTTLTLETGTSYDMSFRVLPANAVLPTLKATTDNDKIAAVDMDGHITALSEGTATVVFSTANGRIAKSCKVTVISPNNNTHSWIIIAVEGTVLLLIVILFFVSYHRFKRNKERTEGLLNPKDGRRAK